MNLYLANNETKDLIRVGCWKNIKPLHKLIVNTCADGQDTDNDILVKEEHLEALLKVLKNTNVKPVYKDEIKYTISLFEVVLDFLKDRNGYVALYEKGKGME